MGSGEVSIPKRSALLLAVTAGVIFYVGLYVWGAHSEGYRFIDGAIRASPEIHERVGDIKRVRLSFFGGYRERFIDSDIRTAMVVSVVGSKGAVDVHASATKIEGRWRISKASIDGQAVRLN